MATDDAIGREPLALRGAAFPGAVGRTVIGGTAGAGRAVIFFAKGMARFVRPPYRWRLVVEHLAFLGNRSLALILLTSAFSGMVLTLQGEIALSRFGSTAYVGAIVALSLVRELGPVLAALMVTARAGSAIAATLGNMRVTEQIDALTSMAVDPVQYLVSPRLFASLVAVPLLTSIFCVVGIFSGYAIGTLALGLDGGVFMSSVRTSVDFSDVSVGLGKSVVFSFLIAWLATYRGFHARGGAEGVGQATTKAVVETSALVLVTDYVMTALLF